MKLLIKYCGGCNPSINRKRLVDEVLNLLQSCTDIESGGENADVGLIVCGCPVCCVNLNDIKDQVKQLVIVGGNLVNYLQVPPDQQASMIAHEILEKGGEHR